ncbi:MAG: hypothetical protein WHS46_13860 [Desulfosoma sp.]
MGTLNGIGLNRNFRRQPIPFIEDKATQKNEKVLERIGRLKGKYSIVAHFYEIQVSGKEKTKHAITITSKNDKPGLKVSRGHAAKKMYSKSEESAVVGLAPFQISSGDRRSAFKQVGGKDKIDLWPEIWSRAFLRAC